LKPTQTVDRRNRTELRHRYGAAHIEKPLGQSTFATRTASDLSAEKDGLPIVMSASLGRKTTARQLLPVSGRLQG
jgi:hypothetical protein